MDPHDFYEAAVLPQFGINDFEIEWGEPERLGPDENCVRFWIEGCAYILISEDYKDLGSSPFYIKNHLGLAENEYEFVWPTSYSETAPSFSGFKPTFTPYRYVRGVTDTFTLLRVYSPEEKRSLRRVKVHRGHGGEVIMSQSGYGAERPTPGRLATLLYLLFSKDPTKKQ